MTISSRLAGAARAFLDGDARMPPPNVTIRSDAPTGAFPHPQPHADATVSPALSGLSGAAVSNIASGLGGARDSGSLARPNTQREYLDEDELAALMRGTLYRRIVELKPRWATMRGWTLSDDTDEERPLAAAMKRLGLQRVMRDGDTWGRAMGEARGLLVTDDPAPVNEPLDPTTVRRLHRIEILDRREFTPIEFNGRAGDGALGDPELYRIHPLRRNATQFSKPVHASRLVRFYGDELPPSMRGYNWTAPGGWGADSIGQTLWDGIRNLEQMGSAGARVAQELTIAVFKLQADAKAGGDQREAFLSKLRVLNLMKSLAQAVWLGTNESFERVAANPTGFADLSEHARLDLALRTGYPLPLLFGIAPGGLNTDGESWKSAWFADVEAHQEDRYRDPLEKIVEVLYCSEEGPGFVPEEWSLSFSALGQLTEKEKAEIRKLHTEADDTAVMMRALTAEEARSRYTQPGGFRTELQPVAEGAEVPFGGSAERIVALPGATEKEKKAIALAEREGRKAIGGPGDPSVPAPFPVGARVRVLAEHTLGMRGMLGTVRIVRQGQPPYYGVAMDGDEEVHKWLAQDELELAVEAKP